jgi:hypothetical protein
MFQTKVVQKIKTHILCSVTFFYFENHAVYEIMWGQATDDKWRKRIACWILKATKHTLRMRNTHCFSTAKMVARTRLSVTY